MLLTPYLIKEGGPSQGFDIGFFAMGGEGEGNISIRQYFGTRYWDLYIYIYIYIFFFFFFFFVVVFWYFNDNVFAFSHTKKLCC